MSSSAADDVPPAVLPTADPGAGEPIDVDAPVTSELRPGRWRGTEGPVLAVVVIGGVVGALARYGAGVLWPTAPDAFPWTTFGINVLGCALIGVLLVVITERFAAHRLVRPLLATGVLGGFTTFSTYAVDAQRLLLAGRASLALAYLAGTLVAALVAVTVATRVTRLVVRSEPRS